jgi:hypothetical protein
MLAVAALTCLGGRSASAQHANYGATGTHRPIALHQLVVVPPAGDAVVALRGYDVDGDPMKATVVSLPEDGGMVYQLSKVLEGCRRPCALLLAQSFTARDERARRLTVVNRCVALGCFEAVTSRRTIA